MAGWTVRPIVLPDGEITDCNSLLQVLFNYCPPPYLDPEYRKQLVVAELEQYNADVACLQEVDERTFHEHLLPHMRLRGVNHGGGQGIVLPTYFEREQCTLCRKPTGLTLCVPLPLSGYDGRYTNKMGKVKEGSATFWRTSRLTEVARRDVLLRDVFREVWRGGVEGR